MYGFRKALPLTDMMAAPLSKVVNISESFLCGQICLHMLITVIWYIYNDVIHSTSVEWGLDLASLMLSSGDKALGIKKHTGWTVCLQVCLQVLTSWFSEGALLSTTVRPAGVLCPATPLCCFLPRFNKLYFGLHFWYCSFAVIFKVAGKNTFICPPEIGRPPRPLLSWWVVGHIQWTWPGWEQCGRWKDKDRKPWLGLVWLLKTRRVSQA